MLVKIVHVKYCPANWQTALQQHRFSTFGGCHTPPHSPNSYAPASASSRAVLQYTTAASAGSRVPYITIFCSTLKL